MSTVSLRMQQHMGYILCYPEFIMLTLMKGCSFCVSTDICVQLYSSTTASSADTRFLSEGYNWKRPLSDASVDSITAGV